MVIIEALEMLNSVDFWEQCREQGERVVAAFALVGRTREERIKKKNLGDASSDMVNDGRN